MVFVIRPGTYTPTRDPLGRVTIRGNAIGEVLFVDPLAAPTLSRGARGTRGDLILAYDEVSIRSAYGDLTFAGVATEARIAVARGVRGRAEGEALLDVDAVELASAVPGAHFSILPFVGIPRDRALDLAGAAEMTMVTLAAELAVLVRARAKAAALSVTVRGWAFQIVVLRESHFAHARASLLTAVTISFW